MIRSVPETAVRMYLGAKISISDGIARVELDGRSYEVESEVVSRAEPIVKAMMVRPREVQYATDVLELRRSAEDLFLEELAGVSRLPKILFVPASEMMVQGFYRASIPADMMSESGAAVAQFTYRLDLAKALRYDILWIQLAAEPVVRSIAKTAKAEGVKIVYDVDDKFDSIPEYNPASEIYVKEKVEGVWELIHLADLVTVSTPALQDYISSKTETPVQVLPNMIMASLWPKKSPRKPDGITRILWAGSASHKADLKVVASALKEILLEANGKVRFTCMGDHAPEELGEAQEYVDLLPFVNPMEYPQALADASCDFAIAPLEDNEFNAYRSAVKYLEYSATGYPSLLSSVGEYRILPKEAPRLMVGEKSWGNALRAAIADPEGMRVMGESAAEWTRHNRCLIRTKAAPWREALSGIQNVPANA